VRLFLVTVRMTKSGTPDGTSVSTSNVTLPSHPTAPQVRDHLAGEPVASHGRDGTQEIGNDAQLACGENEIRRWSVVGGQATM
jgi:hypothetical protein